MTVRCDRCGRDLSSPVNLWAHRHRFDLLSECDRLLIRRWLPFVCIRTPLLADVNGDHDA